MNNREQEWVDGMHTGSSGKQTALKDLPYTYLQNIINKYGSDHDVSALQKELESRPKPEE